MPNPFFSGRIPQDLDERIKQYVAETGESKTDILINALATYLNYPVAPKSNPVVEVSKGMFAALEERVAILEKLLKTPDNNVIDADNKSDANNNTVTEFDLDTTLDNADNINKYSVIIPNSNNNEKVNDNSVDNKETKETNSSNVLTTIAKSELLTSAELRQLTGIAQKQIDGHKRKINQKYKKLGLTLEEGKILEAPEKIESRKAIIMENYPYDLLYAGQNEKGRDLWSLLPFDNNRYQQLSISSTKEEG